MFFSPCLRSFLHFAVLAGAPDPLRCRRHIECLHAHRIGERVHHRSGRADRTRLAAALHAERIVSAGSFLGAHLERRNVVRARHAVVEIRPGDELAGVAVVIAALGERLAYPLREPAEGCYYDRDSGQLVTGSYLDYCMPRADDVPTFKVRTKETPCTHNPLGVKG